MIYPHQVLINKHEIELKQLPKELQQSIRHFDQLHTAFETAEEEEDAREVKALKKEMADISSLIAGEIREHLEEEELGEHEHINHPEEKIPKDKEGILRYLYNKNIRKLTVEELKLYGYPVGFWGSLPVRGGETIGPYKLYRDDKNKPYELSKFK